MTPPPKFKSKSRLTGKYPNPSEGFLGNNLELNNWVISEFITKEIIPVVDTHPFPIPEIYIMVGAVTYFNPDVVFEWGTNVGKSARIFYEIKEKFGQPFDLYTIDLPDSESHEELPHNDQFAHFIKNLPVTSLRGDGLETSLNIYKEKYSKSKALFFLDGDHAEDSVTRELSGIFESCSNPCVIIHDTFFQTNPNYNIGPHKAIQSFLKSDKKRKILLETNYGLPGMTVLI